MLIVLTVWLVALNKAFQSLEFLYDSGSPMVSSIDLKPSEDAGQQSRINSLSIEGFEKLCGAGGFGHS